MGPCSRASSWARPPRGRRGGPPPGNPAPPPRTPPVRARPAPPPPRALALLEASWTQIGAQPAFGMIAYGDAGTLIVHQPRVTQDGRVAGPGRIELVSAAGSESIEPPSLPPAQRDGPTYFLSCLRA